MLRAAHWALGRRGVSGYTIVGRVHNSGKRLCSLLDRVMKYDVTIYRVYHCSLSTFHHGRSINLAAANPETVEIWFCPILYLNVYQSLRVAIRLVRRPLQIPTYFSVCCLFRFGPTASSASLEGAVEAGCADGSARNSRKIGGPAAKGPRIRGRFWGCSGLR